MKKQDSPAADVILGVIVLIAAIAYGLLFKILGGIP